MNSIFVFGSNLAGRHGKGAALYAKMHHGAINGRGEGIQGDSYAIPTKTAKLEPLPLDKINEAVARFLDYARANPDKIFTVTRIGCGLAGYKDEQISPMFKDAPDNCKLPSQWKTDNLQVGYSVLFLI